MSKSGLDIVGLPNLIQTISNEKKTGVLRVESKEGEKAIYLQNGDIQQVSSPQKPSILAEGLRRHPDLDEESYLEMCQQQRETGQSLASLLLGDEEGVDLIVAVCQFQILEEICEMFIWEDCHCEFIEGEPSGMLFDKEILDVDMAMDTNMVVLEAARRYDEWQVILEHLPSKKDVLVLKEKMETDREDVQAVLALIDGFRDVEEVLAEVRLSPFAAMKILAELVEENHIRFKTGPELIQMAQLDVLKENKVKSIKLYERAEELGEKSPEVTQWLAKSYESMGMKEKAASNYQQLAHHYLQKEHYQEAAEALTRVVDIQPGDLEAQERLVTVLLKAKSFSLYAEKANVYARWLALQDRPRAIRILTEAIEKYPANVDGLDFLGVLYQEEGAKQKAIEIYQLVAQKREEQKETETAIQAYKKIVALDTDNLQARQKIAEIYEKAGKNNEALEEYRLLGTKIISRDTWQQSLQHELALVSEKILAQAPDDLKARRWLAQAHMAEDKKQQAIGELEELLEKLQDSSHIQMKAETLSDLVALKPDDLPKRFQLAEIYLKMKREREAIQEYFNLGTYAVEKGNSQDALEAFDKLLSHEPSNYATRLKKAELLIAEKKQQKAIHELMLTGYLSMGADKQWQAVKAFRKVLTLDREAKIICYLELGRVYEKLSRKQEAIAAYKKHVQKSVKRSNFGDALATCEHILEIEPEHEWASAAREKLVSILPEINDVFERSVS